MFITLFRRLITYLKNKDKPDDIITLEEVKYHILNNHIDYINLKISNNHFINTSITEFKNDLVYFNNNDWREVHIKNITQKTLHNKSYLSYLLEEYDGDSKTILLDTIEEMYSFVYKYNNLNKINDPDISFTMRKIYPYIINIQNILKDVQKAYVSNDM